MRAPPSDSMTRGFESLPVVWTDGALFANARHDNLNVTAYEVRLKGTKKLDVFLLRGTTSAAFLVYDTANPRAAKWLHDGRLRGCLPLFVCFDNNQLGVELHVSDPKRRVVGPGRKGTAASERELGDVALSILRGLEYEEFLKQLDVRPQTVKRVSIAIVMPPKAGLTSSVNNLAWVQH